jgi:hypothetical protein
VHDQFEPGLVEIEHRQPTPSPEDGIASYCPHWRLAIADGFCRASLTDLTSAARIGQILMAAPENAVPPRQLRLVPQAEEPK